MTREVSEIKFWNGAYGAQESLGANHAPHIKASDTLLLIADYDLRIVTVTEQLRAGGTREYDVPFSALCQIHRKPEAKTEKKAAK